MADERARVQREKLRPYIDSGFLAVVEKLAKEMTAPYWWYDPELPLTERVLGGGTMCIVDTGKALLGITAAHIHRAVTVRLRAYPRLAVQVGGHTFDPNKHLSDIDDDLDLAVYALSQVQVDAMRAHPHSAPEWPPRNDAAWPYLACGWLWHLAESKGQETTHSFLHFIAKLTDETDRSIVVHLGTSSSIPWSDSGLAPGTNLGGMSGGPIYRLDERGLMILHLVGVISEYHSGMEFVRARPLSLVGASGGIVR